MRYRLLFINLVSAERPPFLVSEIAAIRAFVAGGGSLLVITDHTNCYFHAYRLAPLLTELGIDTFTDGVCDGPPYSVADGHGWLRLVDFKPHPVTAGLRCIAPQTGGRVDPRFAVAFSSAQSWADAWSTSPYGKANAPGFYGNFERDPGEPAGPHGMVLAKTLGRGRIVGVGDENMLGASYAHYADNYRLWLNSMAWLLDDPRLADAAAYENWRRPRIVLYEPAPRGEFGNSETDGSYHALVLLSRFWWTFATDRLDAPADLVVFAYHECALEPQQVAALADHLRRGRHVLILNAESQLLADPSSVVPQVLAAMGGARATPRRQAGALVFDLPAAGSIRILGVDRVFDNGSIGPPTCPPNETERQHEQTLLDAVREALRPSERGAGAARFPRSGSSALPPATAAAECAEDPSLAKSVGDSPMPEFCPALVRAGFMVS